jgi:hypothetical protein
MAWKMHLLKYRSENNSSSYLQGRLLNATSPTKEMKDKDMKKTISSSQREIFWIYSWKAI